MMAASWKKDVQIVGVIQSECNGNEEFLCGNQRFILYNKDILDTLEFDYIMQNRLHYEKVYFFVRVFLENFLDIYYKK